MPVLIFTNIKMLLVQSLLVILFTIKFYDRINIYKHKNGFIYLTLLYRVGLGEFSARCTKNSVREFTP